MSDTSPSAEYARIAKLAYRYWEERGRPDGSPDVDWHRAVASLIGEVNEGFEESLVASVGMGKRTF